MNKDVERSRARVSRRRALALGGTVGLSGLIAACAGNRSDTATSSTTAGASTAGAATSGDDALALLTRAPQCVASKEETQGPYWFDVDSIRNDIREDRPGTNFELVLRVQNSATCTPEGGGGIANAVVEIWHCDAGGVYSGFESGSMGANGGPPSGGAPGGMPPNGEMPMGEPPTGDMPMGAPPQGGPGAEGGPGAGGSGIEGSGETSNGSYSVGDAEATPADDGTYLRGAQTTDSNGVATFTTIFPGWYTGRTTHIHLKVHVNKETVLTTQLFFEEDLVGEVYATSPYDEHSGWENNVTNATDTIFDESGMVTVVRTDDGYRGAINIGI
ncbi:Protocatechuate dioxygenase [Rhodococcus sp. RD6.2]|uniref:protocatechuate dioxygenase n=1 Tax=Rhodococcus sp. RD6.2 TaxID=260936 RepID=UPI00063BBE4C|nr:protocatechuate dioxygenase [Rhodococcus sp. RD6.2]CRK50701.1 Protocatechuate dioxygenase [Rhodococcus sp. RD6.2]